MTAIVIDLKDFFTRTPDQVIRVFLRSYSPKAVEGALWEVFKVCDAGGKESDVPGLELEAVAGLFDHLIALTRAIHDIRDCPNVRCPVCGHAVSGGGS